MSQKTNKTCVQAESILYTESTGKIINDGLMTYTVTYVAHESFTVDYNVFIDSLTTQVQTFYSLFCKQTGKYVCDNNESTAIRKYKRMVKRAIYRAYHPFKTSKHPRGVNANDSGFQWPD